MVDIFSEISIPGLLIFNFPFHKIASHGFIQLGHNKWLTPPPHVHRPGLKLTIINYLGQIAAFIETKFIISLFFISR